MNHTVLHIASKQSNAEIVEYLLREGTQLSDKDSTGRSALYDLVCSAESSEDKCIFFFSKSLSDEYVQDAIRADIQRTSAPTDPQNEKDDETILHVIAANGLTPLVSKFYTYFTGEIQKDRKGDTVLHTAARNKHFKTLKELIEQIEEKSPPSLKNFLNKPDEEGERVLHLVCKHADRETVQYLINKGADLDVQDHTGNTPLHDMVDKAAADESPDEYFKVWKVVIENVVGWWCTKLGVNRPYKSNHDYKLYQRDALYYLRSEIPNEQYLSVIQLAATKGLVKLVKEIIWVDEVFV